MIQITVYYNTEQERYTGFDTAGHAGYAAQGSDIICSAVSALVVTTINAVEMFTDTPSESETDEAGGVISYRLIGRVSSQAHLLMQTMVLGLKGIETEYGSKYLKVSTKEV